MTPARGLCAAQLNLHSWVNWTPLHGFAKNTTSSKRQRSVLAVCDVSRDFFHSCWAIFLINLVCLLLGWSFLHSPTTIFVSRIIYWSKPIPGIIYTLKSFKLQNTQLQIGTASELSQTIARVTLVNHLHLKPMQDDKRVGMIGRLYCISNLCKMTER